MACENWQVQATQRLRFDRAGAPAIKNSRPPEIVNHGSCAMKSLKVRVAEVSYANSVVAYAIIADNNVQARDLLVHHLGADDGWKSIRVRSSRELMEGPPRVIGKIGSISAGG